jgi:hypothetical protein
MVLPKILGEYLVNEIVGIVLVHLDLFEDHAAFAGDVAGIEDGVQDQVAEHVESDRHVLIEDFYVEADALFCGERVHVPADRVHEARNVSGGAVLGPLEDHVLQKMRDAIEFRVFVAGTGLHPDPDRNGPNVRHLFGKDGESVRQDFTLNIPEFFDHRLFDCTQQLFVSAEPGKPIK